MGVQQVLLLQLFVDEIWVDVRIPVNLDGFNCLVFVDSLQNIRQVVLC